MNNIAVIARRELSAHFASPTAYISIALFLAVLGIVFFLGIPFLIPKPPFFEGGEASLRYMFEWMVFLFAIFLPAVSMRLIAEERRIGTIELLMTLPVTETDVIVGKLLGSAGFLAVALLMTVPYVVLVALLGSPDPGPIVGGYAGVILVGASYLSIGLLASSWTSSQIMAFLASIAICTVFTFIDRLPEAAGLNSVEALNVMSFGYHFRSIARGVIDSRDIVFFAGVTALSLSWAVFSLESRKWKKGA